MANVMRLETVHSAHFTIRFFHYTAFSIALFIKTKYVPIMKLNNHLPTVWNFSSGVIFLFASLVPLITMTQRLQFLKTETGKKILLFNKNTFYLGQYVPQSRCWRLDISTS